MARTLGYQIPNLLSREISSFQGNLHKIWRQFCRAHIDSNLLFSFLFGACLIVDQIAQVDGIAQANNTVVAKNDNIANANGLESGLSKYASVNDTFNLLQDGEKYLHLDENKNVILVVGNTGSGKTTLTHFIAGNNSKLRSVEVEADTGDYIIKDENSKIGHGVNSKTIIPERVRDAKSGLVYYDCPGFSDTRNAAFDIAANYFLKKTIDHVKSVKIILAISYSSVRIGVDRIDFMKLLRHVYELVKDIEMFSESVALVITKVDNKFVMKNKELVLVSDANTTESIAKYIKQVREDLEKRLKTEQKPDEIRFYKKSIFLIDIFLRQKRGQYVNIALFRRPDTDGPLSNIELLQDGKKHMKNIIENVIVFAKKTKDDFGFTVSGNSKLNIVKLVDIINGHLLKDISDATREIEEVINSRGKSENFYNTKEGMNLMYLDLVKTQEKLENCSSRRELVQQFTNFINSLDVKNSRKIFLEILKKYKYLEFLEEVSHESYSVKSSEWAKPLRAIIEYARGSVKWYIFLTDLYEKLPRYEMYTNFYNKILSETPTNRRNAKFIDINKFMKGLKGYGVKNYEEIHELDSDFRKQQEVNSVLTSVYGKMISSKCSGEAFIIKGDFIKLSDVSFTDPCSNPVKAIKVFGLNTVFIDADVIKTGGKVNIFVIAPRWEVVGTRKVVLDGVHQATELGSAPRGQDGKPGLSGGTAGNFVGIGTEIVNAGKLTISANGGNGGQGQNGGEGLPGINGQTRIPHGSLAEGEEYMREEGFEFVKVKNYNTQENFWDYAGYIVGVYNQIEEQHYMAFGTKGTAGQDGGLGGAGGKGGLKGQVLIYGFNNAKDVSILSENGSDGSAGAGGAGGVGGKHGLKCRVYHETKKTYWFIGNMKDSERKWVLKKCYDAGWAPEGRANAGISYASIKNPDGINAFTIHSPVNKYKSYLLSNIKNGVKDNLLMKFYSQLSNNEDIGGSYDSIGLCHELKMLETHSYNLRDTIKLQDLYNSLLKRIDKYSKSPKGYEVSLSHKKLLNFLHTATLSKIVNLENDPRYDLVVDVSSFFTLIANNIEKIKHNAKKSAITEFNKDYKKKIDVKIDEVEKFINNLIIPNLEEDEQRIGHEFDKLIDELLQMQNNSEVKKAELMQKEKELANSMKTKSIFSVLKMFKVGAQFFGPVGQAVSTGIEVTSKVAQSVFSDRPVVPKLQASIPEGVKNLLGKGSSYLENFVQKKATALNKFMDKIFEETQKYPNELKEISTAVSGLKSNLTNAEKTKKKLNPSLISSITSNIKGLLKNKIKSIKSSAVSTAVNTTKELGSKLVGKISNKLGEYVKSADIMEVFTDDYTANEQNREKLVQMEKAIEKQQAVTDALRKLQLNIYQTVFPLMTQIRESLSKLRSGAPSNFDVTMHVLHQKITSSLKEMKELLRKIINGFKVHDSIQRYVDKMEETITLFLKIYEKVYKYNEVKELSDYIADINSADANQITTDNNTINAALNELDIMIDYNIVLEQFQKAIYSFKQFVFPFSSHYLEEFDLHNNVSLDSNLGNLVKSANYQIKKLNTKLIEHNLSIKKNVDMHIYEEYFQAGKKYGGPFFVWDSDEYETTISQLLSGKKVVLKSDILTSIHEKNAIKFNKIEIDFNSGDKELLRELKQHLKEFDVKMKHSGSSYYRCDNNFYLIKSDSQTLYYSFEKSDKGEPVRKNNVYKKIKKGQYMLSPYTVWTIQLKHVRNHPFDTLQKFIGKVDLELVGHGQFVSPESTICSSDLKKFYEPVDTISVTDTLNEKV